MCYICSYCVIMHYRNKLHEKCYLIIYDIVLLECISKKSQLTSDSYFIYLNLLLIRDCFVYFVFDFVVLKVNLTSWAFSVHLR